MNAIEQRIPMHSERFAILDRDGTLIKEKNYLASADGVELIPGAASGLRSLQAAGFGLIVVTNQSGIGRGYFSRAAVDEIHARMEFLFANEGVTLDAIFVCPHAPEDKCACRKPLPGLAELAMNRLGFSAQRSVVIGDKSCDVELGRAIGARTVLVRSGYGAEEEKKGVVADYVCDGLAEAAEAILAGQ